MPGTARDPRRTVSALRGVMLCLSGLVLVGAACSSEPTVPLDTPSLTLPASTTTIPEGASYDVSGHINNEGVDMGLELARQQCLGDPELVEGVVVMSDEESGAVVAEFRQECAAVRR